jgi:hypothetical protein
MIGVFLRRPGLIQARFVFTKTELYKWIVPINGKPVERRGRKTMGLQPCNHGHDRQVTENEPP